MSRPEISAAEIMTMTSARQLKYRRRRSARRVFIALNRDEADDGVGAAVDDGYRRRVPRAKPAPRRAFLAGLEHAGAAGHRIMVWRHREPVGIQSSARQARRARQGRAFIVGIRWPLGKRNR